MFVLAQGMNSSGAEMTGQELEADEVFCVGFGGIFCQLIYWTTVLTPGNSPVELKFVNSEGTEDRIAYIL